MGGVTAPVDSSGAWPAWTAMVSSRMLDYRSVVAIRHVRPPPSRSGHLLAACRPRRMRGRTRRARDVTGNGAEPPPVTAGVLQASSEKWPRGHRVDAPKPSVARVETTGVHGGSHSARQRLEPDPIPRVCRAAGKDAGGQ